MPRHTSLGCHGERTGRGTDCLGKQRRAGASGGWPRLPCRKTHVLNMSEPEVKGGTQLHGQAEADTCSAVVPTKRAGCGRVPAQKPCSWTRRCLLLAQISHFSEQTCLSAPRHAGSLDTEAKPQQKEGTLHFCASQWVEFKPQTRKELF